MILLCSEIYSMILLCSEIYPMMILLCSQGLSATVVKLTVDWNTTAHRSVFHTICCIWENFLKVKGEEIVCVQMPHFDFFLLHTDLYLSPLPSSSSSSSSAHEREGDVTSLGELGKTALTKIPVSVVVNLETAECQAKVDRRTK